jgi:hypothetical protein
MGVDMEAIEASEAVENGDPDRLRDVLGRIQDGCSWEIVMRLAICSGSLDCGKVLYDNGYEQRRLRVGDHPAVLAVQHGRREILRFVVDRSGVPSHPGRRLWYPAVMMGGVELLQYLREQGCVFNASTTDSAADEGNLEALRYLHMAGAPWNCNTLYAAVRADSLPCLEYMHGCSWEDDKDPGYYDAGARSLPVLRYVCEHMNPFFADKILDATATGLNNQARARQSDKVWEQRMGKEPDWPLMLYVGQIFGGALPKDVKKEVATQKERAAALAGVVWKARKLVRAEETRVLLMESAHEKGNSRVMHADAERIAMWDAMGRVPEELRERIAAEAHLTIL